MNLPGWRCLVLVAALVPVCIAACSSISSEVGPDEGEVVVSLEPREAPPPQELVLGPQDLLRIGVWRQDDLGREIRVDSTGSIFLPLVGEVPLAGLTPSLLRSALTERYSAFVRDPQVSVDLLESPNQKVFVLGEVQKPGSYPISSASTALQIVSEAGGFTRDADLESVVLVRGSLDTPVVQRLNLKEALSGHFNQDVYLMRGDIVYVNREYIADLERFAQRLANILEPVVKTERALLLGAIVPDAVLHGNVQTRVTID